MKLRSFVLAWAVVMTVATPVAAEDGNPPSESAPQSSPAVQPLSSACPTDLEYKFTDLHGNSHQQAIECIRAWRIAIGNADGTYQPDQVLNRAQLASFVLRLLKNTEKPLSNDVADAFDDDDGLSHESAINQLAAAGIVNGTGPRQYSPGAHVTRGQMASFLVRAYELHRGQAMTAEKDYFSDDAGNTHEANINKIAEYGLAAGTGDGYQPYAPVSRGQMGTFLARTLNSLSLFIGEADQEFKARETDYDENGKVVSDRSLDVTKSSNGTTVKGSGSGGSSTSKGCRDLRISYERTKSYIFFKVHYYEFEQFKHWCWDRAAFSVTKITDNGEFRYHDGQWYSRGEPRRYARRYEWVDGQYYSGHYTKWSQGIENCVLKYGCLGNETPYVEIRAHSNGTYTFESGR